MARKKKTVEMKKSQLSQAVWVDDDDQESDVHANYPSGTRIGMRNADESPVRYLDEAKPEEHRKRLREQYKLSTVHGRQPKWARMEEKSSDEDTDYENDKAFGGLARFAGKILTKPKSLAAKHLDFKLLRDPTVGYQQGAISDLKFHPSKPVLVTASTAGKITLFQICDEGREYENPQLKKGDYFLQDVSFPPKFRIDRISFFDAGNSVLANATNTTYCYTYDLMEGNVTQIRQPIAFSSIKPRTVRLSADGTYIAYLANLADVYVFVFKTMEHIHTFRGADELVDFCFAPINRETIYAQAVNGTITVWNLRQRAEQTNFFDDGCVRATSLCCSSNGQFIACGSNTGIVNIYELDKWYSNGQKPSLKPSRTFDQLTTSISWIRFNRDSQLLAMGSDIKRISARLGHCVSGTAFENFPSKQEHFCNSKLISCDFSPNSAFCAFGTNDGKTRLYRLKHFDQY